MEEGSDSGEEEEHMGEVVVVDNQMMGACLLLAATAEGDSLFEMVSVDTLLRSTCDPLAHTCTHTHKYIKHH